MWASADVRVWAGVRAGVGVSRCGRRCMGLAELFEEHYATSINDTEQSKLINLLEMKQIGIDMNKMDCDIADSKQYSTSIKNCKASTHKPRKLWSESWMVQMVQISSKRAPTTNRFWSETDRVSWKWYE